MPWHARLQPDYALEGARSVARFAHAGPLRVLQSLYPQGPGVCHNVLLHPPGGLARAHLRPVLRRATPLRFAPPVRAGLMPGF